MQQGIEFYLNGILLVILAFSAWKDWTERIIPNAYLIRGIAIRLLLLLHEVSITGRGAIGFLIIKIIISLMIIGVGIGIRKMTKEGVGMGDIKLIAVMFLYLDGQDWVSALFCSLLIGMVHALISQICSKRTKSIPFAPSLFLGTLITVIISAVTET